MTDFEEGQDERAIVAPHLRVVFRRAGNRWTHTVDIRGPGPWSTLAEAVEWDPTRADPTRVVSPVFQEVHFQRDGEDALALLVGQSGSHHFSASFRVLQDLDGAEYPRSRVEVDVADRCRSGLTALASTYRVDGAVAGLLLGPGNASYVWEPNCAGSYDACLRMLPGVAIPARIALTEGHRGWQAQVEAEIDPTSKTQRFRYEWSHTMLPRRLPSAAEASP
jgi:hypothetical protein